MKRIIICADGTWNRPEENIEEDIPTNVLKLARGIAPTDDEGNKQIVFYDWGIGSYHDKLSGGGFGAGLEKNVMDGYRFLVHNYEEGDKIYLFGFSRGAYTIRSLSGLLNNCHILKGAEAKRVEQAFKLYKNPDKDYKPNGTEAKKWREKYSLSNSGQVTFVGAWDTVGAMGLPFSFFGLIKDEHRFYDRKLGGNITVARHALSLDERRDDFEPTIWTLDKDHPETDLKQVWFAGVHSDIGGGYTPAPEDDGKALSDIPMKWIIQEAKQQGLKFDDFLEDSLQNLKPQAKQHDEYKGFLRFLGKYVREIPDVNETPTRVHSSVKERYENTDYQSTPIEEYRKKNDGVWPPIEE
jgi:uncharacterized protein (DUF2235 family)